MIGSYNMGVAYPNMWHKMKRKSLLNYQNREPSMILKSAVSELASGNWWLSLCFGYAPLISCIEEGTMTIWPVSKLAAHPKWRAIPTTPCYSYIHVKRILTLHSLWLLSTGRPILLCKTARVRGGLDATHPIVNSNVCPSERAMHFQLLEKVKQ